MVTKFLSSLVSESFARLFASILMIYSLLMVVGISFDTFFNPWLVNAAKEWPWYSYLFSPHTFTVAYLNYGAWVVVPICVVALIWSLVLYYQIGDYMDEVSAFLREMKILIKSFFDTEKPTTDPNRYRI